MDKAYIHLSGILDMTETLEEKSETVTGTCEEKLRLEVINRVREWEADYSIREDGIYDIEPLNDFVRTFGGGSEQVIKYFKDAFCRCYGFVLSRFIDAVRENKLMALRDTLVDLREHRLPREMSIAYYHVFGIDDTLKVLDDFGSE